MSIRILKESLIAATELDMIGGEFVFLAFEIDVAAGLNRQKLPFKWTTADFGMDFNMIMSKWVKMVFYQLELSVELKCLQKMKRS